MIRIEINPDYEWLRPFILRIADPLQFAGCGEVVHAGRNVVKRFERQGLSLSVKSYGHLSPVNRVVYGTLRKSKAERAYRHAWRLRDLGIDTPEGVAFVEIRKAGLLRASYFVSLHSEYRPVMEFIGCNPPSTPEGDLLLNRMTDFLYWIHWNGVLHKDLNIGNILCAASASGGYAFQVIDTNRMEFHRTLSMRQRMRNLRRLSCPVPVFLHVLERYAHLVRSHGNSVQLKGVLYRLLFEDFRRLRIRLKSRL